MASRTAAPKTSAAACRRAARRGVRGRRAPRASAPAMAERGGGARDRAERERPVARGDPERDEAARDGDRGEEDRVQDDEEAQQRARRVARAPIPARRSDQRVIGRAAHAGGGQQPRRGRAAERHLRALAEAQALARAAADHPEEGDVAGEGEQLEDRAADDPARVGVEGAAQRVGEGVQRASRRPRSRAAAAAASAAGTAARRASARTSKAGTRMSVSGSLKDMVFVVARRLRAFRFASTSRRPGRMHARRYGYRGVSGRS